MPGMERNPASFTSSHNPVLLILTNQAGRGETSTMKAAFSGLLLVTNSLGAVDFFGWVSGTEPNPHQVAESEGRSCSPWTWCHVWNTTRGAGNLPRTSRLAVSLLQSCGWGSAFCAPSDRHGWCAPWETPKVTALVQHFCSVFTGISKMEIPAPGDTLRACPPGWV